MRKYKYLILVVLLLLVVSKTNAQRRIGLISDIHPGFTSLSVASGEPIKAVGIGISLMKWRKENKFVTTSLHHVSNSSIVESSYLGELYTINGKSKATSLEFIWSKLFGNMEADDPFVMYSNFGIGVMKSSYSEIGTSLDGKKVKENFNGNDYSSNNVLFIFGLGSEFRVAKNFYVHTDLNVHLDLFAIGFVPRIGAYYRLY